jgi:hypothetical protein
MADSISSEPRSLEDVVSPLERTAPPFLAEHAFGKDSEIVAFMPELANKLRDEQHYAVLLEGPRGLSITVQDAPQDAQGHPLIGSRADGITQWRALVTAPAGMHLDESVGVHFRLLDAEGHVVTSTGSVFLGPKP